MTPTNTEALAIAEALEKRLDCSSLVLTADVERAAAELRRLLAELALLEESNAQLREQNTEVDKACAALEAENSKLLAKVEVAEAGYEAAVRRAEWQATTNAELNRLTEQRNQARAERDALVAERDTLQVGIELMQDNAARYCWLRDNEDGDYGICVWDSEDGWARDARSPSVVDAAIDAAMKGTQ